MRGRIFFARETEGRALQSNEIGQGGTRFLAASSALVKSEYSMRVCISLVRQSCVENVGENQGDPFAQRGIEVYLPELCSPEWLFVGLS